MTEGCNDPWHGDDSVEDGPCPTCGATAEPVVPADDVDEDEVGDVLGTKPPRQLRTVTEGTQASAFPGSDAPPGSIIPPTAAVMENATWMRAGPEIVEVLDRVIAETEDFEDLRGRSTGIVWSRNRGKTFNDEPMFAWCEVPGTLEQHFAEGGLPEIVVVLSYKAIDALRSEGQYLNREVLAVHIDRALSALEVSEGGVVTVSAKPVQAYPGMVRRRGLWTAPERLLHAQAGMFEADERERQRAGRPSGTTPRG